jgi:hypothetical protein
MSKSKVKKPKKRKRTIEKMGLVYDEKHNPRMTLEIESED